MESNIFKRIEQSTKPDFGDVLSKSFELYKKVFTEGLVHSLVGLAVAIPFILLVYIPILPAYIDMIQNAGDPYYQPTFFEDYGVAMMIGWFVLVFLLSFIMQAVNMSIYGHFLKLLKNKDTGTTDDIGGYFTILKENFGLLLVLSLATLGIALLAALLCYLPILYVIVPLNLTLPIFVFNKGLTVGEIIKAAFKLGNKYWGVFFGIFFVSGLIASLGIIACYIGLLATMFFSYIGVYYAYKDTVGFDDSDAISSIGQAQDE